MNRFYIFSAASLAVLLLLAGIVWASKDPAPGSREDPLITKSYADSMGKWQRSQIPAGGTLTIGEGTEFVVIFANDLAISVEADKAKMDKVIDLTLGAVVGDAALTVNRHYICAASGDFPIKFTTEVQVLIRNGR